MAALELRVNSQRAARPDFPGYTAWRSISVSGGNRASWLTSRLGRARGDQGTTANCQRNVGQSDELAPIHSLIDALVRYGRTRVDADSCIRTLCGQGSLLESQARHVSSGRVALQVRVTAVHGYAQQHPSEDTVVSSTHCSRSRTRSSARDVGFTAEPPWENAMFAKGHHALRGARRAHDRERHEGVRNAIESATRA